MADLLPPAVMAAMRPTLMDRLIGTVAPNVALDRAFGRAKSALVGEYAGAAPKRSTRNWFTWETSGNAVNSGTLKRNRSRSRDLARNEPIALGAINTVVTNVVGSGLKLHAQVNAARLGLTDEAAEAWETRAEEEFALWCRTSDFLEQKTFAEIQSLVVRQVAEAGDVLVVRRRKQDAPTTYKLRLQLIEAERLSNPDNGANTASMVDGVALDKDGIPTGYSICNVHPTDINLGTDRKWNTYDRGSSVTGAPLILHLFDERRVGQARGVPYLAPVIESLKELSSYREAELRAAVISALFTVFVKKVPADNGMDPPIVGTNSPAANINPQTELAMGSGAIIDLAEGEDVTIADPKRPNIAFQAFVEAMCKQIGVALELPFEVLMKSFNASYSASRAALEMAWQFFSNRREWLAARFCQPVYEWVITEAIVAGRLSAPGFFKDESIRVAYLGAEWVGDAHIQLDPQKEASADLIDINMGSKTIEQVCIERTGGTFESKHRQRAKEQKMRKEAGLVTPTSLGAAQQMQQDDSPPPPKGGTTPGSDQ